MVSISIDIYILNVIIQSIIKTKFKHLLIASLYLMKIFKRIPSTYYFMFFLIISWRFCLEIINQFIMPLINNRLIGTSFSQSLYRWSNWDGGWYSDVIKVGYQYIHTKTLLQQNVAFFPAYPILVKIVNFITTVNFIYAGLLLNILITFGIVILSFNLFELFIKKYNKTQYQKYSLFPIVLPLLLPTSFYFASFYSDALLVFCLIASIYFGLKNKYILAAFFGGMASGTNPIGIVAIPTLLIMLFQQEKILNKSLTNIFKSNYKKFLSIILIGGSGLFLYITYLWMRFNSPLAFINVEKAWGRSSATNFFRNISKIWNTYYIHIFNFHFFNYVRFGYLIALSNMTIPIIALLMLIVLAYKKVWWLFTYTLLSVLIPMSTGTLTSINRFSLILIPVFLFTYSIVPQPKQKYIWIIMGVSAMIQICLVSLFLSSFYFVG